MVLSKNLNNNNLFIVGGTGFIGSNVKKSFENGLKVTVIVIDPKISNRFINTKADISIEKIT